VITLFKGAYIHTTHLCIPTIVKWYK